MTVLAVIAMCACARPGPKSEGYVMEVLTARTERDAAFRSHADPIPDADKGRFLPLSYYAVDATARVPARLVETDDHSTLPMVYSDGAIREVRRVGRLEFTVEGRALQLSAFVEADALDTSQLFVPFADATNGVETYHSGRLLDLNLTPTGMYDLDFNRAYNPMCYFNPRYSCPMPLKENRLSVEVRAGERVKTSP